MKLKGNDYICPYCNGHLRANNKIILSAKKENGDAGLLLFDPQLGNYKVLNHPSFLITEGENVELFCSICHENLVAKEFDEHLAKIKMTDDIGNEYDILFSKVVGEKCTYKIRDGKVEYYGADSGHYTNFFGETPKYE
ncbi:MAG: hypothetical protein GXO79_00845 [Chlorobi bacterium]|nr:hypothetical protein [Chlorobiota bacterium]